MEGGSFRKAQESIARAWRLHCARKHRSRGEVLVRIELDCQCALHPPVVLGSFTRPKWGKSRGMSYSLSRNKYVAEAWMSAMDLFQVEVEGKAFLLPQFLQSPYHQHKGCPCQIPASTTNHCKRLISFYARKTTKDPILSFAAAASLIPKDGKLLEDAHFLDSHLLGVADGVGGWRGLGIDSGLFASELIQACKSLALSCWSLSLHESNDSHTDDAPCSYLVPLAETALKSVSASGSSTLLLCALVGSRLEVLNLGDSKAVLIRFEATRPTVVMRTFPMQHAFNCPYQVACTISDDQARAVISRCEESQKEVVRKAIRRLINDGVGRGQVYTVAARDGDLLVVGSDGLWDNLYEREVLETVSESASAEDVARRLTYSAYLKSRSKARTPFEDEAVATFGQCAWKGGKQDDITVISAWIRELRTDSLC